MLLQSTAPTVAPQSHPLPQHASTSSLASLQIHVVGVEARVGCVSPQVGTLEVRTSQVDSPQISLL